MLQKRELRDDFFDKHVFCQVEQEFDRVFLCVFGVNRSSSHRFFSRLSYGASLVYSPSYRLRKVRGPPVLMFV